jgi:Protein of unknown function (DUF3592)
MPILIGIWLAAGGGVAALAGLTGIRRARRLRRCGVSAWAVVVPRARSEEDHAGGQAGQTMIQYALADGQVVELYSPPRRAGRSAALSPGQRVLVWYDAAEPTEVLVYGRHGSVADLGFVSAGMAFIVLGSAIAAFGR